ncbi:beige/beach-related [Anaeramoeba ignava]|uniref:Beige/beach-related n=1 Tax=Anaeramoeba ignava TaxID=1746090 RepID=A0A9Q0RHK6_ANAIG|nr:beige/beach-related [Anaeramoeba ignava]
MINQLINFKSSSIQNPQELITICFSFLFSYIQNENENKNENEREAKKKILLTYLQILMQENYNFLFGLFSSQNKKHSLLPRKSNNSFVFSCKNIDEFEEEIMKKKWEKAVKIVFFPINEKICKDIEENEKEFVRIQSNNISYLKKIFNQEYIITKKEISIISNKLEKQKQNIISKEKKRKLKTETNQKKELFSLQKFNKMIKNLILEKYPLSSNSIIILDKEFKNEQQNYYIKLSEIEDEMRRQKKLKFYSQKNENENKQNLIKLNQKIKTKINEIEEKLSQIQNDDNNSFTTKCEIISKTKITKGIFEITENSINFFNFDLKKEKEKSYSWKIENIEPIHKRRYLFNHSALEIFFENRKCTFFNFETMEKRNEIYEKIQNHKLTSIYQSKYNYSGNESTKWIEKTQITEQWQERKISNFEYIMYLNTISGRSYQDISQYPIFPWIISDYESEKLDLNNPEVFRDLSKPIGILNNKIITYSEKYQIKGKEQEFDFNYQTLYSNPEIVSSYLIRLEPFTSICLEEKYPIFKSIPETWKKIKESSNDFNTELIPEFFHLPDFLRKRKIFSNENEIENQIENEIENVELPKWAKTPEEFIQIHKEALESEYVSEHINEWIDLIFGYKQKGKEAKKSINLFHPNLYEENIDFSKFEKMKKSKKKFKEKDKFQYNYLQKSIQKDLQKKRSNKDLFHLLSHYLNGKISCYQIQLSILSEKDLQ